jgi:acyl-CoA synthetase (AMP-forming)/AMP-acid ligase II
MNYALSRGATLVVFQRFDLDQYLAAVQTHRITFSHLVPPILVALAKHPLVDQYDASSLQGIMSGAAPLGGELDVILDDAGPAR